MSPDDPLFANWSTNDLSYTVSVSKISCLYEFYFAHVVCCYMIALSGTFCFISRLHPVLYRLHAWSGRIYLVSMMWATATSLLIHNTGLPPAVLLSFIWALGGMTLAWFFIIIHKDSLTKAATAGVAEKITAGHISAKGLDLNAEIALEKGHISRKKTCVQRMVSWKAAHGAIMFMSYLNIVGRIFASDQSGDFQCYTQPYYKPAYTASGLPEPVPAADANYARLPWAKTGLVGWGIALSAGPLFFSYLVGAIWAAVAAKCSKSKTESEEKLNPPGTPKL